MSEAGQLLAIWLGFALGPAIMLPLFYDELVGRFAFLRKLGAEGRVVVGLGVGALWPLLVVVGVLWVGRAGCRGVAQVYRAIRPPRSPPPVVLPRAEVRR